MMSMLRTILIGIAAANVVGWVTWNVALWIAPAHDAEGHPRMVIGQAFVTIVATLVAWIGAMVVDRVIQQRSQRRAAQREAFAEARVVSSSSSRGD